MSNEKLNEILSTCPNIVVLSLRGLSALSSISFVEQMPNLEELDLFGCTNLIDLSVLDSLTNSGKLALKTLRLDNPSVDLTEIQKTISGLDLNYAPGQYGFLCSWAGSSGFYATGDVWENLSDCRNLTRITGNYNGFAHALSGKVIDLSLCSSLTFFNIKEINTGKVIFPNNLTNVLLETQAFKLDFEFDDDSLLDTISFGSINVTFENNDFLRIMNSLSKCKNIKTLNINYYFSSSGDNLTSLTGIENLVNTIPNIVIVNFRKLSDIENLSNFTNIRYLDLHNCDISNADSLKNCTKMTNLFLNSNRITNLSMLKNMSQLKELNLNNNLIEDTASIGEEKIDNLDILINLYNTGNLRKLNISGNSIINWDKLRSVNWETKDF